ncbi:MAG: hypothetical protein J6Z36_03065, partial [Clostridia bacterium]|nr:hypothetical protein [Clostridia bacterium]
GSLKINEKLWTIEIPVGEVYEEIISKSTKITEAERAEEGDIARVSVKTADGNEEYSFRLGKGFYPQYEQAVLGKKAGETLLIDGETLTIQSIKRINTLPPINETVISFGIDGVNSVEAYKAYYIKEQEDYRRGRLFKRLFGGLAGQVVNLLNPEVSEADIDTAFEEEKQSYFDYVGGDAEAYEEELLKDYPQKDNDIAAAEAALRRDCAVTVKRAAAGKILAIEDGFTQADEDFYAGYLQSFLKKHFLEKIKINITEA